MPRTHAVQPGAAGVTQPWFRETRLQRQHRNCRAEATSRWSVHEHRCNRVTHTHGGLTPAALVPASRGRCTVRDFCATAFGSPYHGGLTPAALVNVRSRIAKIVFSPADIRTATRAGGVSPPWDVLGMRSRNAEIQRVAVATVVSDQRRANASRWTKASAIAIALLIPTAG